MYAISTPDGDLYACGRACIADVLEVLPDAHRVAWSDLDLDVFCAGCAIPLGGRRLSARLIHQLMTTQALHLYAQLGMEAPKC